MKHTPIEAATLSWQDNTPISDQFDDIYFNKAGGLDETDYVFLRGNRLQQRFAEHEGPHFTIAETGFGTGLNFLCARQLWLQQSRPDQQLHFISVEKFPLSRDDLARALAHWPQLADGAGQLIAQYPPALAGFHRLILDGGRVRLTLMLGDADDCFPQLDGRVDAWFLDGFAPAKNPAMWSDTLFRAIAAHSAPGTSFATFTAAGLVRRGLQQVGFDVEKVPGFGRKREMLVGRFAGSTAIDSTGVRNAPWFQRPQPQPQDDQPITLIGGGLAGCCTAWALAQRGRRVRILERGPELAGGGSGNRQGALYAKPTLQMTKQARLHSLGMLFSQRLLAQLDPQRQLHDDCGVMLTAPNDKTATRFEQVLASGHLPAQLLHGLDAAQASEIAGLPIHSPALLFPAAGWVNPPALCRRLAEHPLIELISDCQVEKLQYDPQQQSWQLECNSGRYRARQVVIANAADARQLEQSQMLPLKAIRGQVTHAPVPADLPALKTVVCADGYISPPWQGQYCFGATFDIGDTDSNLRSSDVQRNLATLAVALPELADALAEQPLHEGRVGYRCASSDYLPLVGELPRPADFVEQYDKLRDDARWPFDDSPPARHPGLYVNLAHGSKGLITAPLCAELLAALICDEPLPLDREICDALDPSRFLVKKLIRQAI
ncbi:bifunctional tRNA (5-methylaminomethyl-2-thiouridine)(34)-methyltransferase MnmD/FAD-dependent 5-carboxymethylaminomethyl-2-thiouridine(34) oxidoreductase MnmC [Marinobacterium arenosum]|uniref:bifunctional tRNA (5-methylaminomethyl-2-thiouridine)(34)-methyltransferase MnmD/FAD-dependent 5-carboxymethylaminomethyl-2-thiouridine(34) oxidoreductase MnmC n=1 Tax=Marinobacterium arenosum TaxID=2862496 RepID=UPI001C9616DB|nr:bifunctional tRNA (5-methylaminomethyl-2-thiouridine)(34)-methyltransferase MnmD/FAD-dependent 5-carboxymethylaminomethyl-2-thiouridine(34) oxidoreductase MnmC [Marinobacterium arenosum]MBY4675989.1 bifunctional tRNA (5-methylaminomethyl-2-thiouridine)(34)-methyltransferase MnmD/FAD-dependent 5-carboxymethylaminomethyl-2-thiouridine(34) oxidoreductase MnmC [Marinobacterium arenosum]